MASEPMKPPTTGERIVWGAELCNSEKYLTIARTSKNQWWDRDRTCAAAIDAAIAAERERIAAFCEANPTKYGDQIAEMIRARGNA